MKVIVAGSRTISDYNVVKKAIETSQFVITELVSGAARGVDRLGEKFAAENNIPTIHFYPDWILGRQAGILRNLEMAEYADALVAVWDGKSRGTKHMINSMTKLNKPVWVEKYIDNISF